MTAAWPGSTAVTFGTVGGTASPICRFGLKRVRANVSIAAGSDERLANRSVTCLRCMDQGSGTAAADASNSRGTVSSLLQSISGIAWFRTTNLFRILIMMGQVRTVS